MTPSKTCLDCGTRLSTRNRGNAGTDTDLCIKCYDLAGMENTHNDEAHEDEGNFDPACPFCAPQLETPATKPQTAPLTWSSHKGHDHPATSKARAACRKAARKA